MKFIYSGPLSGATLNVGTKEEPKALDVIFHNGKECELPEENPYVQTLIALGHLKPVEKQPEEKQDIKQTKIKEASKNG